MCCFSRPVAHVGGTRIFARHVGDRQALVYSMSIEIDEDTAMVLPLPVARAAEDALAFVDLSGYATLFKDLDRAFPEPPRPQGMFAPASRGAPRLLAVHEVGDFVASFVPSPADFERLDPRFRITPELFAARPAYGDFGFAVFQLAVKREKASRWKFWRKRSAGNEQTVHPMAFTFASREPDALFFPTLHVHDGTVPTHASFDHALFAQVGERLGRTLGWDASEGPASRWVNTGRTGGLVDGDAPLRRQRLTRQLRNLDLWVRPAAYARAMAAEGASWRWTLAARSVHGAELREESPSATTTTMQTRLDDLHDAFARGVPELLRAHEAEWQLAPLEAKAPECVNWIDGPWALNDGTRTGPGAAVRCRARAQVRTERTDPQEVELGFAVVPPRERMDAIERALSSMVLRALA